MNPGKVLIVMDEGTRFCGPIDLSDPKVIEAIAKASYEDTERPDYKWAVDMPWDSLEPLDKALEVEQVEFTLKALLALASKTPLVEDSKK